MKARIIKNHQRFGVIKDGEVTGKSIDEVMFWLDKRMIDKSRGKLAATV